MVEKSKETIQVEDIKDRQKLLRLKKERERRVILYWLYGAITALLSFLAGMAVGPLRDEKWVNSETGAVYPYALAGAFVIGSVQNGSAGSKARLPIKTIGFVSLIMAIIAFKLGADLTQPVHYYTGSIDYSVYSKDE